jgi:hypothetical protein
LPLPPGVFDCRTDCVFAHLRAVDLSAVRARIDVLYVKLAPTHPHLSVVVFGPDESRRFNAATLESWRADAADALAGAKGTDPIVEFCARRVAQSGCKAARKGGRPSDTNHQADAKLAEAWNSGHFRTHAELAREKRMPVRDVKLALERDRKRKQRRGVK